MRTLLCYAIQFPLMLNNCSGFCINIFNIFNIFFFCVQIPTAHHSAFLLSKARAIFQFYPENPAQMQMITLYAMKAGFTGGIVVDYPNSTRAKKTFLCLFAGVVGTLPQAKLEGGGGGGGGGRKQSASFTEGNREKRRGGDRTKHHKGSKEWILQKKERRRRQAGARTHGETVRADTKFTGRKRKPRF